MKNLLFILFAVLAMNVDATPNTSSISSCEKSSVLTVEDECVASSKVKIKNRTDYRVKIYIDGEYEGKVYSDDYEYFRISPGYHRVTVQWSSGYYEYFDFYVERGYTHKIWTSDYDG